MDGRERWAELRRWINAPGLDSEEVTQGVYDGSLGLDGYGDVLGHFGFANTPENRRRMRELVE